MGFNNQIGSYKLYFFGKRPFDADAVAYIYLYNNNSQYIGYVGFYRDGQNIPNNSSGETSTPKQAYLKMHERQIDTVVDML